MSFGGYLKADTETKVVIGPVVAVGDGFTPVTNLDISTADEAEIMKHNAAAVLDISAYTFAAIASADGYYNLTIAAGAVDTEGRLVVLINDDSLCLPVKEVFMVQNANVFDSLHAAATTDYLQVDTIQVTGTGQTANDNGADINAILTDTGTTLDTLIKDIPTVAEFEARSIVSADYVVVGDTLAGVTLVATTTDLTNAASNGDLTATMKTSVNTEVDSGLSDINLDHLMKTAVASNSNMTAEVTDGTVLSNIMTKGSDTSDFVVGDDSLEAIRDNIIASLPQNHASTANTETGNTTLDGGTYADTATNDDSTYYQTGPGVAVGGFGLNCHLTFGIGTGRVASTVIVDGHFASGAARVLHVWAYDYLAAAYVQLSNAATDFPNSVNNSTEQYSLTTNMRQVSDGEVLIRFTSTSETVTDVWHCDYVSVSSVAEEAAGLTADVIAETVWAYTLDPEYGIDSASHVLYHMNLQVGSISTSDTASSFTLGAGKASDHAHRGAFIMVADADDSNHEIRRITAYSAGRVVVVDRAFSFTPAIDDHFHILSTGYGDVNTTHIEGSDATDQIGDAIRAEPITDAEAAETIGGMLHALYCADLQKQTVTATARVHYKLDDTTILRTQTLADDDTTVTRGGG